MLRPRRRLVLEGDGETVDVAKPAGVGDTGCENISMFFLGGAVAAVTFNGLFFFRGAPSVEMALLWPAVNEELRHEQPPKRVAEQWLGPV